MTDLNTYVVTFNCGREIIDTDFFASHLFDGLKTHTPPDLIVLCLQEVAPIAYSFLSAAMMSHYTSRFEAAVTTALKHDYDNETAEDFLLMQLRNVGMTAIMLFARRDVLSRLRRVDTAGVGVGLWDMGNKGAVGVRLWVEKEQDEEVIPLTFVSAHLAPMESAWERRNLDWRSICERLVFTPDSSFMQSPTLGSEHEPLLAKDMEDSWEQPQTMFSPAASLFFAGDLNYRTADKKPQPEDHTNWPALQKEGILSDELVALLKQDQLTRERSNKRTLHLMDEAKIEFPPTYKYSSNAQTQALRLAASYAQPESSVWAQHRIPSWCDRILYLADKTPQVHSYTTLPIQPTSDHRPVVLSMTISVDMLSSTSKSPFSIDKHWHSKRAAARRLEFLVGIAAYLTLTYEGNAALVGSVIALVGGILALRSLTG